MDLIRVCDTGSPVIGARHVGLRGLRRDNDEKGIPVSARRNLVAMHHVEQFVAQCLAGRGRIVSELSHPLDGIAGNDGDGFGVGNVESHGRTFGQR